MTDDFHFYLLRRADDYVTAIRPTADIDRFGFPAWHGWAISKAWRDGYAAAINEGGQAPCESTDGCTRAQVTWEQAISHAGTDHEMAAQPVPPSPDDTEPSAWRVMAKGGRFARGLYEAGAKAAVLAMTLDGDSAEPLYSADALRRERERVDAEIQAHEKTARMAVVRLETAYADRDRLAAECEHWRNVTARANPTDCAVGIKQLYDNWQQSQAECERLRADAERWSALRALWVNNVVTLVPAFDEIPPAQTRFAIYLYKGKCFVGSTPTAAIDAARKA